MYTHSVDPATQFLCNRVVSLYAYSVPNQVNLPIYSLTSVADGHCARSAFKTLL